MAAATSTITYQATQTASFPNWPPSFNTFFVSTAVATPTANADSTIILNELTLVPDPSNCTALLIRGRLLTPEPDISGIGIILSFLISAWALLLLGAFAYVRGFLEPEILQTTDKRFYRVHSRRHDRPSAAALARAVLIFSDQQTVTGIAILVAALAKLDTISIHHYKICVYLAWLSANVHLATLVIMKSYFRTNPAYFRLRIVGMTVLFLLLLVALIPTFNPAALVTPYYLSNSLKRGIPAKCYWQSRKLTPLDLAGGNGPVSQRLALSSVDTVITVSLLVIPFLWRCLSMWPPARAFFKRVLLLYPQYLLERGMKASLGSSSLWQTFFRCIGFRILAATFVFHQFLCDLTHSFSQALWFISISMVWGTVKVLGERSYYGKTIRGDEDQWGFGQIVAMMLLLLPIASSVEDFLRDHEVKGQVQRQQLSAAEEIADQKRKSRCNVEEADFLPSSPGSSLKKAKLTLSGCLRDHTPRKPSRRDGVNRFSGDEGDQPPHVRLIRQSSFYAVLFWSSQLFQLAAAALVGVFGFSGMGITSMLLMAGFFSAGVFVLMAAAFAVGMCSSRVLR